MLFVVGFVVPFLSVALLAQKLEWAWKEVILTGEAAN